MPPSNTFLESAFTNAAHSAAWGELAPVPWVKVQGKTERDDHLGVSWLVLGVQVAEHHITNDYFPLAKHDRVPVFRRPGGQCMVRSPYSDNHSRQDPSPATTVNMLLMTMVQDLSFLLREHDPRTGSVVDEGGPLVPRSPLFDPPRMRPPQWERGAGLDSVPCPFCHRPFGRGMPAMWSGGTLLWTHPACWADVHS